MSEHECNFVEEQEPEGRLILTPCIECGVSAADAIKDAKSQLSEFQSRIASLEQVVRELSGAISNVVDICSSEFGIDTYQFDCFHIANEALKHSQEVLGE